MAAVLTAKGRIAAATYEFIDHVRTRAAASTACCPLTRCLHFTAGCTTDCMKQRSKAAVWTVDGVARLIEMFKKEILFIYLFLPSVAYDLEGCKN